MAILDESRSVQKAERDVLLYRILSGKLEYNNSYIKEPLIEIQGIGSKIYKEILKDCIGVLTDKDIYFFLIETEQWSPDKERRLDSLPKEIENTKVFYFQNYRNPSLRKQYKYEIEFKKITYRQLLIERNKYKNLTKEGIASGAMWFEMINHMYSGTDKLSAINHYHSNRPSETEIRSVVQGETWLSIYSSSRNVFGKPAIKLTEDQRSLLVWSNLYKNCRNGPEAPALDIISDHDAFDGWLILQSRKNKVETKMENMKGILPNAKNVYFPISDQNGFEEIMAMNTPEAIAQMNKELREIEQR